MSPSSQSAAPGAAPLPPLPNLSGGGAAATGGKPNPMAAIVSGIAPLYKYVQQISDGLDGIVNTGMLPGAAQVCGQLKALVMTFIPQAIQQQMQPQGPQQGPQPMQGPGGPGAGPVPPMQP